MFSMNGRLYTMCIFITRYMGLNLLYVAACIPIVTIPAATAALFSMARKNVNRNEPPLFATFWKAFRDNFVQATVTGGVLFAVLALWWIDSRLVILRHWAVGGVILILLDVVAVIAVSVLIHIYPIMVHMKKSTLKLVFSALKMGLIKPHLTVVNLVLLYALYYLSALHQILFFTFFFSVAATLTYWLVNMKFKFLQTLSSE